MPHEPREKRPRLRDLPLKVREIGDLGIVTREQLVAEGFAPKTINLARASNRLFDIHPGFGVYSIVPPELLADDGRLVAALAAVEGEAWLAGGTAAHRWELIAAPPRRIELVARLEYVAPEGVHVRRSPRLRDTDVTHDGRFPLTTVTRTLLDLGIGYRRRPLGRALAEAEFRYDVRPKDVLAVLRRGHPGSANLRRALELHVPGYGRMRSRLERRFRELLIEHGIELPLRNHPIGPYSADCLWPDLKLVVEVDGAQHERPHQAAVDARRDAWLRAHGYTVRRYSDQMVYGEPALVVADLLATMAELRGRRES